jgi:hypothetical protein
MSKTVECLNTALHADRAAIRCLMINTVPCNMSLANHEFIIVEPLPEKWSLNAMGLLNGVLTANGLPCVEYDWSKEPDSDGHFRVIGFKEVIEKKDSHDANEI